MLRRSMLFYLLVFLISSCRQAETQKQYSTHMLHLVNNGISKDIYLYYSESEVLDKKFIEIGEIKFSQYFAAKLKPQKTFFPVIVEREEQLHDADGIILLGHRLVSDTPTANNTLEYEFFVKKLKFIN